jgi:CubicO group peptidase (beta-lactamase class C family)
VDPSPDRIFALTDSVLAAGLAARAFPAATIEVGCGTAPLWRRAYGRLHYESDAAATTLDTIFDLASLTKVIATTSLVMRHVAAGTLDLDAPLADYLVAWRGTPQGPIRVRQLLTHASGLPPHARCWELCRDRRDYQEAILAMPLERPIGTASVYSDLGFILLGFILEDLGGPLTAGLDAVAQPLGLETIRYQPPDAWRDRIAPTEFDMWRNRLLVGEVHDENAAALGGIAGHAGVFGAVGDVGRFARAVLRTLGENTVLGTPALMRQFTTRADVPESSRALGWDTMLPTSSCGSRLSPSAFGHTGFTGTSLWIDPEMDLYVVLLTNRVHPTRANDALRALRPRVHDAVVEDLR